MAFKEIYVDPSIAANSGAGTVGDPYGDLDYAIVQETQGTTGTRLNIKRGTDEILTRELGQSFADTSVSAAWSYALNNPIIFQGYDTAAGDLAGTGNRAGISGGGSESILDGASALAVSFIDLHLHNTGTRSNGIVRGNSGCHLIRCEIDNNNGQGAQIGTNGLIIGCYFHDLQSNGVLLGNGSIAFANIFTNTGSRTMDRCISMQAATIARNNIISIDGATDGITSTDRFAEINGNSIFSAGGTGHGLRFTYSNGIIRSVTNNLIEGFSGTSGAGILFEGTKPHLMLGGRNLIYNCETSVVEPGDFIGPHDTYALASYYEVLTASPFTNAAALDFSPVDTGNVKEGAVPSAFMTI